MTLSEAVVLLTNIDPRFLQGLTPAEFKALTEAAAIKSFPAGALITREGFPAESIALLVQGGARFSCTTPEGKKLLLRWIHPGEVCGLAAVLPRQVEHTMNAEAVRPSAALVWQHPVIRSFLGHCPQLIDNILLLAYEYLSFYRVAYISASCRTARERLAVVLENLADGIGRRVEEGLEVSVGNEELAHEANVTIFTASRLLNEWQREGRLVKTRGKVVLRSPKTLLSRGPD